LDLFDRWVDDIAAQQADAWRSLPFRQSAEACRSQGVWLPLAAPETPAATESEPEPSATPVDEDVFVAEAPAPAFAEAPPAAEPPVLQEPLEEPVLLTDLAFDLDALSVAEAPAPSPASEAPVLDLTVPLAEAFLPEALPPQAPAEAPLIEVLSAGPVVDPVTAAPVVAPEFEQLEDFPREAVESGFADVEQIELSVPADLTELPEEPVAEPSAVLPAAPAPTFAPAFASAAPASAEGAADESVREIGPLRIGHRLYNVFLNEADEWSRRLGVHLSEWALETHAPVPEAAEALAHSLAGSSATVGFESLSGISRTLEHALASVAARQRDGRSASAVLGG